MIITEARETLVGSTATTFSIAEAALELGITERRVRQLIEENRLKPETDGMGRQRLSRAQIDRELKRRGRVSIKSLPGGRSGPQQVDPLISRADEQLALLRELIDLLRDRQRDASEQREMLSLALSNQRALVKMLERLSPDVVVADLTQLT